MKQYYLFNLQKTEGPYTLEEMLDKKLSADTMVFSEKINDWRKAGQLPEFRRGNGFVGNRIFVIILLCIAAILLVFAGYKLKEFLLRMETDHLTAQLKRKYTHKHINELVYATHSSYSASISGGIDDLKLSVQNSSAFNMDLVIVKVNYLDENGMIIRSETHNFKDVVSHSAQTIDVPPVTTGCDIECMIVSVSSEEAEI